MLNTAYYKKIVNPAMAAAPLSKVNPFGEFKALIKFAEPKRSHSSLTSIKMISPNVIQAHFPCDQTQNLVADKNVISIEIREHIASSQDF